MSSPSNFFNLEQLTPSSSPISLSLDDSRNLGHVPSFATLLASPTKFKLSDAVRFSAFSSTTASSSNNNDNNKINDGNMLTTSLSKLKTYKKNTNSIDYKNIDLSSVLFKEQNIHNNNSNNSNNSGNNNTSLNSKNNKNIKPLMFKQEFVSNYTSLPLLSTLLKVGGSLKTKNNVQKNGNTSTSSISNQHSNNINPLLDDSLPKLSIKETLERIQKHQQLLNNSKNGNNTSINERHNHNTTIMDTETKKYSQNINSTSNNTISTTSSIPFYNNKNATDKIDSENAYEIIESKLPPTEGLLAPPLELHVTQRSVPNKTITSSTKQPQHRINDRIVSNTSTVYSDHMLLENGINVPSSVMKYPNPPNNRYSFISSTSTDYDNFDFIEQVPPMVSSRPIPDINEYTSRLESSKMDLKIKQLEVEINELKLQNIKLINSITTTTTNSVNHIQSKSSKDQTSSTTSQRCSIDLQDQWTDESDETIRLRNKVKELEKKIDSYKRTISKYQHNSKPLDFAKRKQSNNGNLHHRISRLSLTQLKRFEETTDPSSSFYSTSSEEEEDTREENNSFTSDSILNPQRTGNYSNRNGDGDYEADIEKHIIELPKRKGFDLRVPIAK